MKRHILLTALMLLVATFIATSASAQSTLRRSYDDLDVDIWTDKDDGSNYYEGDPITIYFRASHDAYVTIYDLDTRGNVNLLFPAGPGEDNFVQGDEIYMIPDRYDDFELTLEGPPGNEMIQIVATTNSHQVPDWRGPISVYDDYWGFKYDGDNEDFVNRINRSYFPDFGSANDYVSFYVAPRQYYQPERVDCYGGDCGQVYIDYPDGCEVYVNGVFWGYAPLYIPSIYLGRHRVTVYWGASIVYNDWILVDAWHPYFVYTRPLYVYDFCYTRWYRHHDWYWHDWNDGPSRWKYKDHDGYVYKKAEARRGYKIVDNNHGKYSKSKSYVVEKTKRIENYKTKYNFDKSTKTYTVSKSRPDVQRGKATKGRDFDVYNGKRTDDDRGSYTKPKSTGKTNTGTYDSKRGGSSSGKSTPGTYDSKRGNMQGKSGGSIQSRPKGSRGSSDDRNAPSTRSNNGGEIRKPVKRDDGNSNKSAPGVNSGNSSGKKSAPAVKSGDGGSKQSSGSKGSSGKSSSGNSGSKSGGSGGGSKGKGHK